MSTRHVVTLAGVLALTFPLAACGGSEGGSSGADGSTPSAGAGKTLSVWIMEGTNPDATAFFEQVEKDFTAKTGAQLDIQMVPWASAKEKFSTAIAGGTTPDVAEIGTTWTPEFADAGALADLKPQVDEAGLGGDLVPGLLEAGTLDGKLYGMPWYAGVRSVVYNKDVFAKAGITTPPANWAQLTDAVRKIKATQPNVVPLPIPGDAEWPAVPFVWGAGGELATQDGDSWKAAIDSPQSVEGITYYTDLALKEKSSTPAAITWKETDVLKAFQQGDVGMIITGSWTPAKIKAETPAMADKLGAFPIPGKESGISPSFLGGSHLGVFEKSENKDLAWEFVKMMTTGDTAKKWGEQSNFFPGQKSLLDAQTKNGDDLTKVFAKQMLEGGKSVPVTPAWGKVQGQKVVPTMLQTILSGKADAKTAAATAAEQMNSALSNG